MKKFLSALIALSAFSGFSADNVPLSVKGDIDAAIVDMVKQSRSLPPLKTLRRAPGVKCGVTFNLDSAKEQYVFTLMAVPTKGMPDGADGGYYEPDQDTMTDFSFDIPAGTYDLVAMIDDDEAAERIILFKENVEVKAGMEKIVFEPREATVSTRVSHVDSKGNTLTLPSYTQPHNCKYADFIDFLEYDGVYIWAGETLAQMECNYILSTNNPNTRFSLYRSDIIGASDEFVSCVFPVDFTQPVCGPTSAEGWQVFDEEFAKTPVIDAYDTYFFDRHGEYDYFTFVTRSICLGNEWWGSTGLGVFEMYCNSSRVALWEPKGYNGQLRVAISPSSNVFSGDDSCIQGLPLLRGENELQQIGLNIGSGTKSSVFLGTSTAKTIDNQYSRYAGKHASGTRANATPLLFAVSDMSGFYYTYKGRFGEEESLQSFNLFESMDNAATIEIIGGQPSEIKIYANDELICPNRKALKNTKWVSGADHKAVITLNNVLIDKTIRGNNTATVCWNREKGNGFAPSFSSMQMRNKADEVTDRFYSAADGVLEFTVADFTLQHNSRQGFFYYEIEPVESVKAEYAPHGSVDFSEIPVQEIPELFFSPGYGYFYRGSLEGVDRLAPGGWYDLRLTVRDADGAYCEQIISHAFNIESLSGVKSVSADSAPGYVIDGRNIEVSDGVRIYSASGALCTGKNLLPGIYIVSNGISSIKVAIK